MKLKKRKVYFHLDDFNEDWWWSYCGRVAAWQQLVESELVKCYPKCCLKVLPTIIIQINTNHGTSSQIEKWKFNVQQTVESEPWLIIDYDQHINWKWKWTQALSQGVTNYGDDIDQHRNQIITRIIIIVMRIIYYDLQIFCTCYWWSTTFKFHEMSLFVKFSHGVSCPK